MRSAIIGALALFSSVDGPQPLAALERTPRPATLAFGEGGPDAVALSAALVSTIGCGESGWCAELRLVRRRAAGDGRAGRAADGGRRLRDAAFGARRGAGGGRQVAAEPTGTSETLRAARARAAAAVAKTGPSRARARPFC